MVLCEYARFLTASRIGDYNARQAMARRPVTAAPLPPDGFARLAAWLRDDEAVRRLYEVRRH